MDVKKILGNNVKKYRKLFGYTQMQLAELLDIEQKHVSFIESGNSFPSAALITKIAEKFDIPPKNLFDFEPYPSIEQLKQNIIYMVNNLSDADVDKIHNYVSYIFVARRK